MSYKLINATILFLSSKAIRCVFFFYLTYTALSRTYSFVLNSDDGRGQPYVVDLTCLSLKFIH